MGAEVERSNKRIGKGVLNGLSRGGKKIRKSILHFRDHKKSGNKNNHKMMELINKEVALISKADKAIAEAKEQSNNYFDEMKAAKDERHKRMMQRRASRKNIREKTSKSGKKPPSISFKTNTPKISGITRQKTMIRKSPVVSDGVRKEFVKKKDVASAIAAEAEQEIVAEREEQKGIYKKD